MMGYNQCYVVSQGANKENNLPMQEIAVEFVYFGQQKMRTFHVKDDNGK